MSNKKILIPYKIPVLSTRDVELACIGLNIERAELESNGQIISILKPDEPASKDDIVELKFLGGPPLRMGLLDKSTTFVTLYALKGDIPSLNFYECGDTTYQSIGNDHLIEDVTIGTPNGAQKNKIIYLHYAANLAIGGR
jgi:hypothetical protein